MAGRRRDGRVTPAQKKAAAPARKSSPKVARNAAADGVPDIDAAVERLTAALAKEGGLDAAPPR